MDDVNVRYYSLCGLTFAVHWEGKGTASVIDQLFDPFPFTIVSNVNNSVHIDLKFSTTEIPARAPINASESCICYDVSIFKAGDFVYITDGSSMFQLRPNEGTGLAAIHCSFKEKTLLSKYNLFLISLIHLLSPRGIYDLHAAALVRGDLCYLLLGDSGSGKSSATLSLVDQGWRYISDDALLLKSITDGIEVLTFRKKFFIDPQLVHHYPEITPYIEKLTNGDGSKRFLDVDSAYPGQFCPKGIPKILIFTSIVSQPKSILMPIDQTCALIKLTNQSSSIFFNRQSAKDHFDVLKQLVCQTESYQLLAGRDLYEEPEKINKVLSAIPSKTS